MEVTPPLGISYLAAVALQSGHEVRVLDNRLRHQGLDTLTQTLRRWRPDIVGISAVSYDAEGARRLAEMTRSHAPGATIMIGGPFATTDPESSLLGGQVDLAVLGEGERVFPELISRVQAGRSVEDVPGIACLDAAGTVSRTPPPPLIEDLDALPFPAWETIDLKAYFRVPRQGFVYKRRRYAPVVTSRGCPYHCIYCHNLFGKRFRGRRPDGVLAEIEELIRQHGIQEIQIIDDTFNLEVDRAAAILEGIIHRGWKLALCFANGLRADLLDERLIDLMHRAGTYRVCVAVESGSERVQGVIRKHLNLGKTRENIALLARRQILTNLFVMVGFPTETREEVLASIGYACDSEAHSATFFYANPLPGTELARMVRERGQEGDWTREPTNYFDPQTADLGISDVPPSELRAIVRKGYWRFYVLRPQRLWWILRKTSNKRQLLFIAFVILGRTFGLYPWALPGRRPQVLGKQQRDSRQPK